MGTLPSEIGPYRIARKLGEGGMGAVYEAVHQVIQRRVAIKVLHPEAGRSTDAINRFLNEARAANLIAHPGLVQITDFGSLPDGSGYLVMEYLEGETLADRLEARGGRLPPQEAVLIGVQIASALVACHKKGIVHRDLKPGNTMLVPDPAMATGERLKVLDFGLAKLSEVREAAVVKTHSQAVLGTPLYMSPEQCEGAGRVDAKTDVYALGCMLYEMLAGRPPFLGEGTGQVIGQHLFKQPAPLATLAPQVPPALTELVDRLLVKSKQERPSMRDTHRALEALAAALPPPRRREAAEPSGGMTAGAVSAMGLASTLGRGAGEPGIPRSKRRPTRLLIGAVLLTVLAGSAWAVRHALVLPTLPQKTTRFVTPVLPAAPRQVTTRVDSEPAGALVIDATDSQVLGMTPWQRHSEQREGKLELTLRLAGHSDQSVVVSLSGDDHAYAALTPQPAAPAPTPAAARATPAAHHAQKPTLKRISAPIKKLARQIGDKLKSKPAKKNSR
jgi:serine/threonine-protein kinase